MPTDESQHLKAISVIESLRSGVPTRLTTKELPDLRPDLTRKIKSDLENFSYGNIPTGRLIWGAYGQGKSHFLTMIEHIALDLNYAVSYVTLSREISGQNLFNLYKQTAPVIRVPNSKVPGIYNSLSKKKYSDLPTTPIQEKDRYSHPLPAIVVECMLHATYDDFDYLYNNLMGSRLPISEIRRLAKAAGIGDLMKGLPRYTQDYTDANWGVFSDVIRFCGFRGWVILIDEVELIARLGRVSRLKAYKNLNWLLNIGGAMKYPIYVIGAVATSLQDYWTFETGRRKPDRTGIPALAEERMGVEARNKMERFFAWAISDHCPKIKQVDSERLNELLKNVSRIHGLAYKWSPSFERVKPYLKNVGTGDPVRTHIRAMIEVLDDLLITGQAQDIKTERLVEGSVKEEPEYFNTEEE